MSLLWTTLGMSVWVLGGLSAAAQSTWRVIADSRPFNAVWMASATDGWAVQTGGGICRTDDGGETWEEVASGVTATLRGVWGTAMNNVWAVGDGGVILRWNGTTWNTVASGVTANLQAIHGNGAGNMLAVGENATVIRWNGTVWAAESLPNGVNEDFFGVWMAPAGVAVAVGQRGRAVRFNGTSWVSQNTGAGNNVTLNAVWGANINHIWAVGTGGVIRFWDGANWSAQTSGTGNEWLAVQGHEVNSVWAVGRSGVIRYFNGSSWISQNSGTNQDLSGLAVLGAGAAVAVGNRRVSTVWDGTEWAAETAPLPNISFPAIWALDDDRVWFGGGNGLIIRWNGAAFVNTPTGTNRNINALWGSDHGNIWAVGNNGTILKWDGASWSAQTSGTTENLHGVWGVSATQVWAVGNNGTILRWNGATWSKQNSGVTVNLNAVWARDSSNIWAVGQGGTILKASGSSWARQSSGVMRALLCVWGSGGSVWAGGQAGTLLKSTGGAWMDQAPGVNGPVSALSGISATSLWAGAGQAVLNSNGTAWSPDGSTGIGLPVIGVFALSPSAVFVSTNSGVLLTNLPEHVPQISAEYTGGAAINDGLDTAAFGSVEVTQSYDINLTIRNTGSAPLTGLSISVDGSHAGDFSFSPALPATLAPNASASFDVTFAPTKNGVRTANLRIASNDPTEPSFLIRLTGSGFYNPVTIITQPQPVAAVVGGQAVFTASATGTAPLNYQWRRNGMNLAGATSDTLTLDPVTTSQNGTYTVVISNPAGSRTSQSAALTVADAALKTVALPTGATATLAAPVFGAVTTYLWSQNGNPMPPDPRYTKWTTKTMQIKGLRESDATEYACDMTTPGGPLQTRTRLIVYNAKPVILTPGPGPADPILMPDAIVGGGYGPWPIPIDPDELLTATSFAASGLPKGLQINKTTGDIFGTPTVALTAARDYVITLTASNAKGKTSAIARLRLFPLPENTTGGYSGPVARLAGFYSGLGGRIDCTINATSSFSGKLVLGGSTLSFRGLLKTVLGDPKPSGEARIKRRNLPELILTFTVDTANHRLEDAKLHDGALPAECMLQAWRNRWPTPMPDAEAAALRAFHGRFNGALLPPDAPSDDLPQGNGYLTFVVSLKGRVTISGRLADGASFTVSTFVGPLGEVLVHRALYAAKGSITGHLLCTAGLPDVIPPFSDSTLADVNLTWLRPPLNSRIYRSGFNAPVPLTAVGGRYLPPDKNTPPMERVDDGFNHNALVHFAEGGIEDTFEPPDILVRLRAAGKVTPPAVNPRKTRLSVAPANGTYSGGFTLLDSNPAAPGNNLTRASSFRGIIVRVGGVLRGFGYFLLAKRPAALSNEKPSTTSILSGQANLDPL